MKPRRKLKRAIFLSGAIAMLGIQCLSVSAATIDVEANWLDSDGNWKDNAKWSGGEIPNNTAEKNYKVTVGTAVQDPTVLVTLNDRDVTIKSLTIKETLHGVLVTGARTMTVNESVIVGNFTAGNGDFAYLSVDNGKVKAQTVDIAKGGRALGSVAVQGINASIEVTGSLNVGVEPSPAGNAFFGSLMIFDGAKASAKDLSVAAGAGSVGRLLITDPGSVLTVANTLSIGNRGTGDLRIADGAKGNLGSATIGANPGAVGTTSVRGDGTVLTISGLLSVGDLGRGELIIADKGQVMSQAGRIGVNQGSNGQVTVSGQGSLWKVDGTISIGQPTDTPKPPVSTGLLWVTQNAMVNGGAGVFIDNGGTLRGSSRVQFASNSQGVKEGIGAHVQPGDSIGTMTIEGDFLQHALGVLDIEIGSTSLLDTLVVHNDNATATANLERGAVFTFDFENFLPKSGQLFKFLFADSLLFSKTANDLFNLIHCNDSGFFQCDFLGIGSGFDARLERGCDREGCFLALRALNNAIPASEPPSGILFTVMLGLLLFFVHKHNERTA